MISDSKVEYKESRHDHKPSRTFGYTKEKQYHNNGPFLDTRYPFVLENILNRTGFIAEAVKNLAVQMLRRRPLSLDIFLIILPRDNTFLTQNKCTTKTHSDNVISLLTCPYITDTAVLSF